MDWGFHFGFEGCGGGLVVLSLRREGIFFLEQFTVSSRLDEAYTVTRRRGEGEGCVPCVKAAENRLIKNVGQKLRIEKTRVEPVVPRRNCLCLTPSTRRNQTRDS